MVIPLRRHLWRHRRIAAIAAASVGALLLTMASWAPGDSQVGMPATSPSSDAEGVDLTIVADADKKGAVCLDGSLPAYHMQKGFGSGSESWLLHIEGGGWCRDLQSCNSRKQTVLGSSAHMENKVAFVGILSNMQSENPDFYNWNKVKIRYCDGASFSGNASYHIENETKLFFRGQRVWDAVMDELLHKGLANAGQAFLTGCSAGGLATFIHCDDFNRILPNVPTVKCLADGGFFIDVNDISQKRALRAFYNDVVRFQELQWKFPNCNSDFEPGQCFFPREILKATETPLFILNSAYDAWMVQNVFAPASADPRQSWLNCKLDIQNCDSKQLETLHGFREALIDNLSEVKEKDGWGIFVNSCFIHCQSMKPYTWHSPTSPRINNKTIAEAVGDWFFDRREVKEIDCAYPCNPTCHNMIFTKPYKQ